MALPSKKKKGLRLLKHKNTGYYWKVREDIGAAMFEMIVGLESKPSKIFTVEVSFVNPSLYFPWFAAAHEEGRDVANSNELDKISPKFIVEAIDFADAQGWQEKKLVLMYQAGKFKVLNENEIS